jgi:hypothetical protein
MEEINKAYQKWDKERTEEAKKLWYKAVRRWSEIHSQLKIINNGREKK